MPNGVVDVRVKDEAAHFLQLRDAFDLPVLIMMDCPGMMAMGGGSSMFPTAIVAWPTGEFAGMNVDGTVKLAYRRELEAR